MKRSLSRLLNAALITIVGLRISSGAEPAGQSVLTYHADPGRSGNFIVRSLTWDRASSLQLDGNFHARVSGHVYAQPLYWRGSESSSGVLLVATEDNVVHAIDAVSGQERWQRSLGKPVPRSSLPCGNISPLGVTGTPVIDASRGAIYLDAAVETLSGPRHLVFALSLKDGTPLPGWPIDIMEALASKGQTFVARDQNQRGALAILAGNLYVAFGGHFGDCGQYRGFVVGISLSDPQIIRSWATRARGGGIWEPGGISTDGTSLFVATGNTFGARTWSDGEAVIRLAPDLHRSDDKRDFFAPSDWEALDARDADLGGSNPLPLEVSGGGPPLILALGKDRKAYLLDRIGGQLAVETVSERSIITVPVTYPAADGIFVALQGEGVHCPNAARGLLTLKIRPGLPSAITTAWCASVRGRGAPIVTTTDGHSNPIVWVLGAEGDNQLHGFRADTGEALFTGPHQAMTGLRHLQTLIATDDRLYVAADGSVYAFRF
jgi:outer membrane protein assembly factor BamB